MIHIKLPGEKEVRGDVRLPANRTGVYANYADGTKYAFYFDVKNPKGFLNLTGPGENESHAIRLDGVHIGSVRFAPTKEQIDQGLWSDPRYNSAIHTTDLSGEANSIVTRIWPLNCVVQ